MFQDYFSPISSQLDTGTAHLLSDTIGNRVQAYREDGPFPSFEGVRIALLGVGEERGSLNNRGAAAGPDHIREELYRLRLHQSEVAIVDLGNLIPGHAIADTYAAIAEVTCELLSHRVIPVVLGGSHDLAYGHYCGYRKAEQVINIVSVDSRFDLGLPDAPINSDTFLGHIILEQPNYLFNFSNLAYQTYLNGTENVALMKKLHFDAHRLGQVQSDLQEAEPVLRNADLVTVDIGAVRQSEAPANVNASPNGLFAHELCQIMYYAGMSDKLSGAGVYEYNPRLDRDRQTARLVAQALWYFIEGVSQRKNDLPATASQHYTTYRVTVEGIGEEIVFIRSNRTERWWMKLPTDGKRNRYLSQHLLPCTLADYQQACANEVPERWWNAVHKMV